MPEEPRRARDPAQRPLRIGLTGGIASGKSAAARIFADLGVPVIDSDVIARTVVEPGTAALAEITAAFGTDLVDTEGRLDRPKLRALVFADPIRRRRLEQILHPRIRETMEALSARAPGPYQVLVIPLLVESGLRSRVDRVLVIDCPEWLQMQRLRQRDGSSETEARAILAAQTSRDARLAEADDVIVNDGDLDALERQILKLDTRYRELATRG